MSNKLIVLIGTSLSGKTTWARQYATFSRKNTYIISRDSERESLFGIYRMGSRKEEDLISEIVETKVKTMLRAGDVILDNTHLKKSYLDAVIKSYPNTDIEFKVFDLLSIEELTQRNTDRYLECSKDIPVEVLERQINQFKSLTIPDNIYVKGIKTDERIGTRYNKLPENRDLPWCVISDLDGTLSMMNGRSAYDGASCGTDVVNEAVAALLDSISLSSMIREEHGGKNTTKFLFSGRNSDNDGHAATLKWLIENGIEYDDLVMRKERDSRADTIIKREMFDEHIRGKYRVLFVLDDRDCVVKMWRDLGIDCFQVNYGNF